MWSLLNPIITFFERKNTFSPEIVRQEEEVFLGWPTVTKYLNTLYIAYSGGRKRHVDPFGKNFLIKSLDEGKTFSEPIEVDNSLIDNRDAGVVVTPQGNLIYSYFTSNYYQTHFNELQKIYGDTIEQEWLLKFNQPELPGSYIKLSSDEGVTYSTPIPVPISTPHGPFIGGDGHLYYIGNVKKGIHFYRSKDEGRTWKKMGQVCDTQVVKNYRFCEPSSLQLSEDIFLTLMRANHKQAKKRFLFQTMSFDGGRTWTFPEKTDILGYPPHLLHHSSGRLIVTYGVRTWPYSIRASFSEDGGKTWEKNIVLSFSKDDDLGYPSTVELNNGSLYTVFYQIPKGKQKAALMATRWHI